MGNPIYKLKCNECNHTQELYVGFALTSKGIEQIKCFYCNDCKKIYFRPANKNITYKCKDCGKDLIEVEFIQNETQGGLITTNIQLSCKKCKSKNIEITQVGLWD